MSSNEWIKYKFGDFANFSYGKMPDKNLLGIGLFPTFSGYRYQYTYPQANCKKGDLIVVARGVGGTGDLKIVREDCFLTNLSIKIDLDSSIALNKFIYYKFLHETLRYLDSGSAQSQITIDDLKRINVSLPSIIIQNRISSILASLDDKIENNLQTNQTLEEIARTIFRDWFINFNYPKADGSRKHSVLGEIPSNWKVAAIGEVCYVQNGYAFKSNDFKDEGEVGIIKIKNINGNVVDIEKTDFVEAIVVHRLDKKFKVETGSLLIAMTGAGVGKIGLVPLTEKNIWLNQRVGMFKEKIAFGNLFMYLLLSSDTYYTAIQNSALGSAQPNISASAIESIQAIIPTADLIEQFGKIVNPIFEKILDNLAENVTLKITRDSLLPRLMSGEIDVTISNV